MKNLTMVLFLLILGSVFAFSQNYSSPECIRWDPVNENYLVSNVAGYILSVDPESMERTEFANAELTAPKGMVVVGNIVYVTDLTEVEGYNLENKTAVFHLAVTGSGFLNGITADTDGFLYAADTDKGTIFKIDPDQSTSEVLASSNLGGINGVLFDELNNRLIAVMWATNAAVSAVNLENGEVEVLIQTSYSNLDGITQDNCGNFYFSSWGSNTVFVTSRDFADEPRAFYTNLNGPADIFFNQYTQELWVPNFNANEIVRKQVFLPCMAPELISPENGAVDQASKNLELSWSPVLYAKSYKIELSLSAVFSDILMALVAGEPAINISELDLNTEYFWRVAATDGQIYSDSSEEYSFTTEETSSIDNIDIDLKLQSYPNPVTEVLHIAATHPNQELALKVVNINGQTMWQERNLNLTVSDVDVSDWAKGTYLMLWETSKGQQGSKKIIVH